MNVNGTERMKIFEQLFIKQILSLLSLICAVKGKLVRLCMSVLFLYFSSGVSAEVTRTLSLSDQVDIPFYYYQAVNSSSVILWLPSEAGILEQDKRLARKLADSGMNVWLADMHSGLFLPKVSASLKRFTPEVMAKVIEYVLSQSENKLFLVTSNRGVVPLLEGVRYWQRKNDSGKDKSANKRVRLAGAILLSPQFYKNTPEPGFDGQLEAVVSNSNLALMLLQPDKSPFYWKLPQTTAALRKQGSDVSTWVLKDVRDRFYYRPDSTRQEDLLANKLDWYLKKSVVLMQPYIRRRVSTDVADAAVSTTPEKVLRKQTGTAEYAGRKLRKYLSDLGNPGLNLKGMDGRRIKLEVLKGKVVLVNFWASWCPPCVHEMPSMQKLENKYRSSGFGIVAVNMAESKQTVAAFIKNKVQINFRVLLDSNGAALKRWKVFAFPTSYLLDRKGKIRYAVFGAIDWVSDDVFQKVEELLKESAN